jgi:ABC-type multidrug transport system fused ATPase/permease subunit
MSAANPVGWAGMGLSVGAPLLAERLGGYGTNTGKALHNVGNIAGTALSFAPMGAFFGPAGVLAAGAVGAGLGLYSQYRANKQVKDQTNGMTDEYKQLMIQRLQETDPSYFNSLSSADKQVYLNTQSVQKKLLGNTINDANNKALSNKGTGIQNFTPEQLHQRIKGY